MQVYRDKLGVAHAPETKRAKVAADAADATLLDRDDNSHHHENSSSGSGGSQHRRRSAGGGAGGGGVEQGVLLRASNAQVADTPAGVDAVTDKKSSSSGGGGGGDDDDDDGFVVPNLDEARVVSGRADDLAVQSRDRSDDAARADVRRHEARGGGGGGGVVGSGNRDEEDAGDDEQDRMQRREMRIVELFVTGLGNGQRPHLFVRNVSGCRPVWEQEWDEDGDERRRGGEGK